ncbi:MAG: hypothetical protein KF819_19615 [Labilithrix sp.]|nr:hypothetical protein [Labilithrix sp.]
MRIALALAAAAAALAASGCKDLEPPAAPPFQIFVRVDSDPGRPVPGATVSRNNKTLATTGPDGRAMLTLQGAEGETTDVSIKCPDAFTSPTKPTSIRLTRFADKTKVPEYTLSCPPTLRRVVVAVKADNGPNLPVVYLNKVITRTDLSGAAHFALEVAPGAQFQVTLDTGENSRLKPPSPTKPFTVGQHDEILLFEQRFELERQKVIVVKPNIPRALN